jgi:23S rRNA pseudouridine1911/1915/1917 synthase
MPVPKEDLVLTVGPESHGTRLDLFLVGKLPSVSRSQIQRYVRDRYIRLNSVPAKAGTHLRAGDRIQVSIPPARSSDVAPEPIPISVLYEDRDIVVIDKPAGLIVHPAGRVTSGTLVNALLHHCKDLQGVGGVIRPGIVHRLDKGTSGVMVAAKHDRAHDALVTQFKERQVRKRYLAVVYGRPVEEFGVVTSAMGRHPQIGCDFPCGHIGPKRPSRPGNSWSCSTKSVWWQRRRKQEERIRFAFI